MKKTHRLLLLLSILLGIHGSCAAALQSHASIQSTVRDFLLAHNDQTAAEVEIEIDRLNKRLRLARCDQAIEAFLPASARTSGRVTVGIRCDGSRPWSLYVPARVTLFGQVVVASREVARGSVLQHADLNLERQDLTRLSQGYYLHPESLVGQVAQRRISRGRALRPRLVKVPPAVARGSRVSIVARIGGIEARMPGRALADGGRGDRIRIENLNTERELEARVVSAGVVRVDI